MSNDLKAGIGSVLAGIAKHAHDELLQMARSDLEQFWFFKWEAIAPVEWNLHQFTDLLELYRRKCRSWEELHNGSVCVVERVRDTYLMPKITEFVRCMDAAAHVAAVPKGWQLVPKDAAPAIIGAIADNWPHGGKIGAQIVATWRAALAVAPPPPIAVAEWTEEQVRAAYRHFQHGAEHPCSASAFREAAAMLHRAPIAVGQDAKEGGK